MSWLCDTTELVPSGWLASLYAGHGVRGADVPSTGTDGPSALFPCLTLPADADVEVRGFVTRWPTLGTLDLAEDGSFVYVGATDYFEFRLHADGVASITDIGFGPGIVRVSLTVGAGATSAFGSGARLGLVIASGTLTGAVVSAFGVGAVLRPVRAGGALFGEPALYLEQPMTSASWSYKQTATLWPLTGRDEWTGAVTHGAPALFLCDYAEDDVRMRSASGEEFTSKLLIYTSLPGVKQGDMVKIGASSVADPFAAGAEEVRAVRTWADTFRAEGDPDFRIAT
jgi:hypothetical protein